MTLPASAIGVRRLLASALVLALLGVLAACGGAPSGGTAAQDAEWSFTDDTGTTVRLPERPTKIAGLTDATVSLWNYGIKPVAVFGFTSMKADSSFDGKDLSGVAEVGRTYGEIDLEAL